MTLSGYANSYSAGPVPTFDDLPGGRNHVNRMGALPPVPPRQPRVGDPATIHLYNDTTAAVVTRVNPKSIVVARVETGPTRPDMASDEGAWGIRPTLADGILDKIKPGTEERFARKAYGTYRKGSIRVTLGRSITRIDHRF